MTRPLRLGLVGAGRWGRNYIKTIAALDGVSLARLASRNPESVKLAGPDCTISADWHELIASGDLDGVIIATPPALHAEMARATVAAGLPVLVEKPLTLSLSEAQGLRDFVAARAGFVMVGHTHLFHPAYRALKRIAPQYGPLRAIRAEAGNHGPFRGDVPVLWDWGAHDVAMCLDLLGALPVQADARLVERRELDEGLGEIVEIRLDFPGEVTAKILIGNIMPKRRMFSVTLDRGTLVYDDLAASKLVYFEEGGDVGHAAHGEGTGIPIDDELPLCCAVGEFAAAVLRGGINTGGLDFAVDVIRVLSSCEQQLVLS